MFYLTYQIETVSNSRVSLAFSRLIWYDRLLLKGFGGNAGYWCLYPAYSKEALSFMSYALRLASDFNQEI